ncbi:MAG TPA: hypothetical protein VJJ20_00475 [Candidatus Paceibacterota bacterium]
MRTVLVAALLLWATAAQAEEPKENWGVYHIRTRATISIACDTLEKMRDIVEAANTRGPYAVGERYRRYHAQQGRYPAPGCLVVKFHKKDFTILPLDGYLGVESAPNQLSDVIIVEVFDRKGNGLFVAINRPIGFGHTI